MVAISRIFLVSEASHRVQGKANSHFSELYSSQSIILKYSALQ